MTEAPLTSDARAAARLVNSVLTPPRPEHPDAALSRALLMARTVVTEGRLQRPIGDTIAGAAATVAAPVPTTAVAPTVLETSVEASTRRIIGADVREPLEVDLDTIEAFELQFVPTREPMREMVSCREMETELN